MKMHLASQARMAAAAAASALLLAAAAHAQSCNPEWDQGSFAIVGTDGPIHCMTIDDSQVDPILYFGGAFDWTSGLQPNHVIGWNGEAWFLLGGGVSSNVYGMIVHDDGSGPRLYVGGAFEYAGTGIDQIQARHIARWEGDAWSSLGLGTDGSLRCFAEFDEGNGPVLFAAGHFTEMDGQPMANIARWDGDSWTDVGGGTNGHINELIVYDDGSGSALYAAGFFTEAGGMPANRIAKWNGTSWSPLGEGLNLVANALAAHDDGTGEKLYVGGEFTTADGEPAQRVARWDGATWEPVGDGLPGTVLVLRSFDAGDGAKLYAGGSFLTWSSAIRCWDGSAWVEVQGQGIWGPNVSVECMALFDDGAGEALFVGGQFELVGDFVEVDNLAKWNGESWREVGQGLDAPLWRFGEYRDGADTFVAAVGKFRYASGSEVNRVAYWSGEGWSGFGEGASAGVYGYAYGLAMFDDGTGEALHVGGSFETAGDLPANYLAKWNDSGWTEVGGGADDVIWAVTTFDDGSGEALYVGGRFDFVGSGVDEIPARKLARWDGSSWSTVGGGIDGPVPEVHVLKVLDDGSGPALFIGGKIQSADGVACSGIVKWDGSSYTTYGADQLGEVFDVEVYDSGDGPKLYVTGYLPYYSGIAMWTGSEWTTLRDGLPPAYGDGTGEGYALEVFDRGIGPELFVGGYFQDVDGNTELDNLATWNGSDWLDPGCDSNGYVGALQIAGPNDELLYVGGGFSYAAGVPASCVTILTCLPDTGGVTGDLDGDGDVDQADLGILLGDWGCLGPDCVGDIDGDGDVDQGDLGALLGNYGYSG